MGKTNRAEDVWQSTNLFWFHITCSQTILKFVESLHDVNWFHSDRSPHVDFAHDLHFQGLMVLQWRPHMQFRTEMEKGNWNIVKVMEYTTPNP